MKSDHHGDILEMVHTNFSRSIVLEQNRMSMGNYQSEIYSRYVYTRKGVIRLVADGWCFAYAGFKADRPARRDAHLFKRNFQATFCCDKCLATRPFKHSIRELSIQDLRPNALWRDTMITDELYRATESEVSPFAVIPGFRVCSKAKHLPSVKTH